MSAGIPMAADTTEAAKIPIFAASCIAGGKARLAMNSDIVKPIPVKKAPAPNIGQLKSGARVAKRMRTASQLKTKTPTGLPKTNPAMIAMETRWPTSDSETLTPALASAKIGMITKPAQGCRINSIRSTGDSASVVATPARLRSRRAVVSPLQ